MLPVESTRVGLLLYELGCCGKPRAFAGFGKSLSLTQWIFRTVQHLLCKCINCLQMSCGTWAKCRPEGGEVLQPRCSTGLSDSYQDKPLLAVKYITNVRKYVPSCSFYMELAYFSLLLKVAVLQASDIIYETESWRTLCKDHNQFLKYDQGFDNPKSFFKKKVTTI